jgi:predicted membrane channel-forming protein YqfA (hemolysin III family)
MVARVAMGDKRLAGFPWNYDRGEIVADGIIHAIGICFGLIGAIVLIVIASHATKVVAIESVLVYAAGLLAMLAFSAAYNLWPVSQTKWILRRFDHSAIFVLIAGTYTPFMAQLKISFASGGLLTGLWVTAGLGVVLKLVLPGRFDRAAVAASPVGVNVPGSFITFIRTGICPTLTPKLMSVFPSLSAYHLSISSVPISSSRDVVTPSRALYA